MASKQASNKPKSVLPDALAEEAIAALDSKKAVIEIERLLRACEQFEGMHDGLHEALRKYLGTGVQGKAALCAAILIIRKQKSREIGSLFPEGTKEIDVKTIKFVKSIERVAQKTEAPRYTYENAAQRALDDEFYRHVVQNLRARFDLKPAMRPIDTTPILQGGAKFPSSGNRMKGRLAIDVSAPGHEESGSNTVVKKSKLPGLSQKAVNKMSLDERVSLVGKAASKRKGHKRGRGKGD